MLRHAVSLAALAVATASLAAALTATASARTFTVTMRGDPVPNGCKPSDCSLREAVIRANARGGRDVIVLPNRRAPYFLKRTGADEDAARRGDLDIANDALVIRHRGGGRATIDARGVDRALEVHAGAPLTVRRLVITGGDAAGADGGGIAGVGPLRVLSSVVRRNVAGDDGGGIDIDSGRRVLIVGSILAGNRAQGPAGDGGAVNGPGAGGVTVIRDSRLVRNRARDGGAVEATAARLSIIRSTLNANRARESGGAMNADDSGGPKVIRNSTVARNRAGADGGGVHADGARVRVLNSTLAANRADVAGGGIHADDGADLFLNAVTVARNVADADGEGILLLAGGGLYRSGGAAGVEVTNSLLGLNRLGAAGPVRNDCVAEGLAEVDSLGGNVLSTVDDCAGFDRPTDRVRNNPRIALLRGNGGPTATIALRPDSIAINRAKRGTAPRRDQRGAWRGRRKDVGAFERRVGR